MKLIIIGSGTAVFNKKRHAPSILLKVNRKLLLFDCGWGCGVNLLRAGVDIQKIDHIFITHPHADHLGNLANLIQSTHVSGCFYPQTRRKKTLYLHGYQGFKEDFKKLMEIMMPEFFQVLHFKVRIFGYKNNQRIIDGLRIKTTEVNHVPELFTSVAFRVSAEGKTFLESGDCGYDERLIKLGKGADFGVIEMSLGPIFHKNWGTKPNHLTPYEGGLIAKKAGLKGIALIHIYDGFGTTKQIEADVRKNFNGRLIISRDLQQIKF